MTVRESSYVCFKKVPELSDSDGLGNAYPSQVRGNGVLGLVVSIVSFSESCYFKGPEHKGNEVFFL